MKKILVIVLALLMACVSVCAFAKEYNELEVRASIEFEGITDADLGGDSVIIGDFDPHGTWSLTEGFATIVEGNNGNGLQFTPNYANPEGYLSSVMRAQMPIIAQEIGGWSNAWGLRFYVTNNSYSDAYVTPMAFIRDSEDNKIVLAPAAGAYTVEDGEYYEAELFSQVDSVGASVLIPSGFEGYVVLPLVYYDGDNDEYECGWQKLPGWSTSTSEEAVNFGNIYAFFMDVRVPGFDTTDTEGIIFDSFEFVGDAGDEVNPPEGEEEPAPTEDNQEDTEQPGQTEGATTQPGEATTAPAQPAGNNNLIIIIACAAAAVVIVVVVIIIIANKKKKAE